MHTSKIYVMSGTACDTISSCLKKTHTTYKISTARGSQRSASLPVTSRNRGFEIT